MISKEEMMRISKGYFEEFNYMDTEEQVRVQRGNHFGEESIRMTEVEVRLGKLKNGKTGGENKITGKIVEGEGDMMVDWIWRLYNMTFVSSLVPEYWRFAVIV